MLSRNFRDLCALAALLLPLPACAALFQIQSSGIMQDMYLNETSATGQFNSSGILPQGARVRNASVKFIFRDEADNLRRLDYQSYPEIGDWVEQAPVYSGYDIHHIHLRSYNHISQSLWRYDMESVDVFLNGSRLGSAEPARVTTITSSSAPVGWQWHHGGSSSYVYAYDSNGRPIFGTRYYDYYNDVANVDRATYWGNEDNFSLTSSLDNAFFTPLLAGDLLNFSLDVTRGDLLFMSATLFIETYDSNSTPEPESAALAMAGLAAIGLVRRKMVTLKR